MNWNSRWNVCLIFEVGTALALKFISAALFHCISGGNDVSFSIGLVLENEVPFTSVICSLNSTQAHFLSQ